MLICLNRRYFPVEDFPEFSGVTGKSFDLPVDEILQAPPFVGTDSNRSVLTNVWLDKDEVVATDGYKLYCSGELHNQFEGLQIPFSSQLLKIWKPIAKYGNWTFRYDDSRLILSNDKIELSCPIRDSNPPEMRYLANSNRNYTFKAIIPYKQIKPLLDKSSNELTIIGNGAIQLDGMSLPLKAEIVEDHKEYSTDEKRLVLAGLFSQTLDVILNPQYLATFPTNEKGEIVLRYTPDATNHVYSIE